MNANSAGASRDVPLAIWNILEFATLWRRKWTIVLSASGTVAAGVVYLLVASSVFEAEARVVVQSSAFSLQNQSPAAKDKEFVATQAEVMHSPLAVRGALAEAPISKLPPDADPVRIVMDALLVMPVLNTDVLRINFRSSHREETVAFVRALIGNYQRQVESTERETTGQSLTLLTQRAGELRAELEKVQREYVAHRKSSPLVGQARDVVSVDGELLRQLSQRLAETRDRRLGIENSLQVLAKQREALTRDPRSESTLLASTAGLEATSAALPTSGSQLATEEAYRSLALHGLSDQGLRELTDLRGELRLAGARERELAQFFGRQHPQRKAAIEQVASLQEQIRQREQNATTIMEHELTVAKLTEQQLTDGYGKERSRVKDLDVYLAREQQLLENIHRVETLHVSVASKLNELDLSNRAIATGRPNIIVRVLEGPESTVEQVWPKKVPVLLVCGVLGLVAGVLWVSMTASRKAATAPE